MQTFLDKIEPFTVKQWPEKERDISHWLKTSKLIYTSDDTDELLKYLQLELMTRRRPMIISRIYSRFSFLRGITEYEEFISIFKLSLVAPPENRMYEDLLVSWDHVFAQIDDMTQADLIGLCHYEYWNRRRPYLMRRLITKYQSLRRMLERKEMQTWNLKRPQSNTSEKESKSSAVKPTSSSALSADSL